MTNFVRCIAVAAALFGASAAMAETASETVSTASSLKVGAVISSSEGRRLGRIDRVVTDKGGAAVSASVIVDSRFIYIPASTITAADDGFKTSLTRAEIRKLK